MAVNADYAEPVDGRGVSAVLDDLELEMAEITSGRRDRREAAGIESAAQSALRRATTASDTNRAEILVRRAARLTGNYDHAASGSATPAVTFPENLLSPLSGGTGFVSLAQFLSPGISGPGQSSCNVPGPPPLLMPSVAPTSSLPPVYPYAPPAPRHFISLDALGWWVKGDQLPALVTTSPLGTPQGSAGVLGLPTTSVLFGDQTVNGAIRPGGRIQGGVWLDDNADVAIEGSYYALATASTDYAANSTFGPGGTGGPILARPFFNISPSVNAQSSLLVAYPNLVVPGGVITVDGSVQAREASNIQSASAGGRIALNQYTMPVRFFVVGGYRFFNLNESLTILTSSTPGTGLFPSGRLAVIDQFATKNYFNGGEIGLGTVVRRNQLSLSAEARLAMGNMYQQVTIDGRTEAISGGFVAMYPGGLLAQPSNMGKFAQNRFSLIPQIDIKLGYQVLPSMRLTIGYNFTYVTELLRPGEQVDTTVNTTQIAARPLVGPARPQVSFSESSIWLQGVTAGMQFAF